MPAQPARNQIGVVQRQTRKWARAHNGYDGCVACGGPLVLLGETLPDGRTVPAERVCRNQDCRKYQGAGEEYKP